MISAPVFCPHFVGRQPELAFLVERRRDLAKAHGGIILIGGDAGIGKSRLVREFLDVSGRSRGRVAIGRCRPFGSRPYGPLVELLTTLAFGTAQLLPARTLDEQLGELVDAFLAAAAKHALVGVIEDLHWSDSGTLDVLVLLAERLATSRMLLVATYRANELAAHHPHYVAFGALQRERSVAGMHLGPLTVSDARRFIDAALHSTPHDLPPDLRRSVARIAEGNPFFTEELLKSALDRERSASAVRSPGNGSLPTTVHAAILERMRPLAAQDREILTQAAVIGRRFDAALLATTLDTDAGTVLVALQRARAVQIVEETTAVTAFRFRHALTREAIYDALLDAQRRPLHRKIALALERQPPASAAPDALAYHWWAAGDRSKALEYGERGGDAAQAVHAYADAVECYERTLSLLEPVDRDAARVHGKIGYCYFRAGVNDRAIAHVGRAWSYFAGISDDAPLLFHLARTLAAATYNDGARRASTDFFRRAVDAIARCGDNQVTDRARLTFATYLCDAGGTEETRAVLRDIDEASIAGDIGLTITFWQSMGRVSALDGDVDGVRAAADRICAIAQGSADPIAAVDGLGEAAISALAVGENAVARRCFARAIDVCIAFRLTTNHGDLLLEAALERVLSGAYDEARRLVVSALPMIGEVNSARHSAIIAALAVGTAIDDRELLAHEPDAAFIERAFESGVPRLYGPLAALCAPLRAARGERDAAGRLLRRAVRAAAATEPLFDTFPLVVVAAELCERADAPDVRRLSARSSGHGPATDYAAELAEAILLRRFGDAADAVAPAQRAAAGFGVIGWPRYEALALDVCGDRLAAQRIRARIGSRAQPIVDLPVTGDPVETALTPREREVARLVAAGGTNRAIAAALNVSVKLVEKRLSSIYAKLALSSRSQLTAHIMARSRDARGATAPDGR